MCPTAVREACRGIDVVFVTAAVMLFSERLPWQYKTSHVVLGRSSATSLEGAGVDVYFERVGCKDAGS